MSYTIEKSNNKATFTLTIPASDVEEGMQKAAREFAKNTTIPGFRPGKAPFDMVKQRVGEMKLLEAAAEELIRSAFVKAMIEEDLETVGQPYFSVDKMAPGNDMIVKAEIALYPRITKMADITKLTIEAKDTKPTTQMIEDAKRDLTMMQTKEVRKANGEIVVKGDKAVVDLTLKKDGVVLEGGEGRSHGIYTGEGHYLAGIVDQLEGMKEGEEKTFTLPFPKDHYQKHLAGQDVDVTLAVKEIFALESPAIDEEFAKSLGLDSLADLESKLSENLALENEREEYLRQEKEMLELIAEKSTYEEIPDLLINQEINQMIHELRHQVEEKGADFDEYLKSINKTLADLKLDFTPTALKRVKIAIFLKEYAIKENIVVSADEVDVELDRIAQQYEKGSEAYKRVFDPRYREYLEHQLRNKKVVDTLKSIIVK